MGQRNHQLIDGLSMFIPLFIGFWPSFWWCKSDFSAIQASKHGSCLMGTTRPGEHTKKLWKITIEFVVFPIKNGWIFHSYVSSAEDNDFGVPRDQKPPIYQSLVSQFVPGRSDGPHGQMPVKRGWTSEGHCASVSSWTTKVLVRWCPIVS